MNARETLAAMETLIDSLGNIGNQLKTLNAQLSSADQELSNLSHRNELSNLSASALVRLAVKERDVLRYRRTIKDEIALLEHIKAFQGTHWQLKNDLIETTRNISGTLGYQRNRKFCPRQGLEGWEC